MEVLILTRVHYKERIGRHVVGRVSPSVGVMMDTEREAVSLNENLQTVRDSTSAGSESREENLLLSQLPTNVNVPTTTETVHEIADGTASCQTAAMEVDCPLAGDTDASPPPVAASPTDSYQRVVMETDRQQAIAISTDNCQGVAMTQDNQQDNRLAIASPTGSSQGGTMEMDSQQATAVSASYQPVDSNVNFTSNLFESHTQSQELPPLSVVISGGNGNDRFSDERLRRLAFRCVGILHILAGLLLVLPDGILIYYNYIDWSKCVGLWMSAFVSYKHYTSWHL